MSWNPEVFKNGGPKDPAEAFKEFIAGLKGPSWKTLAIIVAVAAVVIGLASSYYQVEPDELGVVRRLGKFTGTSDPGPHFRLPFGVDRVQNVPVQRQLKMEFGFRTTKPGVETRYQPATRDLAKESMMLTGDLNVAVVEWIVQFKIKDPYAFLFRVRNVDETLRILSESTMRFVVGDHSVNEVLTTGRQKVANEAKALLQQLADRYETGVDIQQVVLQDVNPPDPVKPSFNEVNQAIQEKERAINDAHAEVNKEVPQARGEAEQEVQAAEGYAVERVNRAKGEAGRFANILREYKKAPDVTRRRMYLESVSEVLPRVGSKVIFDEAAKGMTPILRMDRSEDVLPAAAKGGGR